jgi:hypothetical protein
VTPDPRPGSPEALREGCQCSFPENHDGEGFPTSVGQQWWINSDCPLHGQRGYMPDYQ